VSTRTTDEWFVGFDPDITSACGSVRGRTTRASRSAGRAGRLRGAADLMDYEGLHRRQAGQDEPQGVAAPGNIVFLAVDTGQRSVLPAERNAGRRYERISAPSPARIVTAALTDNTGHQRHQERTKKKRTNRFLSRVTFVPWLSSGQGSSYCVPEARLMVTRASLPTPLRRGEPEIPLLSMSLCGPSRRRPERARSGILRLRVEPHQHVLLIVAGLQIPDRAVA